MTSANAEAPRGAAPAGSTNDTGDRGFELGANALGLPAILVLAIGSAAPLLGALGNIPLGYSLGGTVGMPATYIVVTVILLLFSVGYVAMARRLTAAGGFYAFISHGIGRPFGLAAGWSSLLGYLMVEVAIIGAIGYFAADTFATLLDFHASWVLYAFIAIAVIAVLTYFDVKVSAKVLGVTLAVEILSLMIMDVSVIVQGGASGVDFTSVNPVKAFSGTAPGIAIFFAFWSFLGFEVVPNYAEESKNPRRTMGKATYLAVVLIGLIYLLTAWAGAVGHGTGGVIAAATNDPVNFFYSINGTYAGHASVDLMKWMVITSSFACALAFHQTTCRYTYAMGREGVLPRSLAATHPKWRSPYRAGILQTALVSAAVVVFIIFWHSSKSAQDFSGTFANAPYYEMFGWGAIVTTFFVMLNQALSSLATILYFHRGEARGEGHWWRTLLAPALGGIGMLGALYLLISNLTKVGGDVIWVRIIPEFCIVWFAIGLGLAFWLRASNPAKYAEIGRFVSHAMVPEDADGDTQPVMIP
jgi:amino acid transporter